MQKPDYNSPTSLKNFLDEKEFAMQKKFGQNFLVNGAARQKLIDSLEIEKEMKVWEIGPGLGSMTEMLIDTEASVTAFEIDKGFAGCLKDFFSGKENFQIVEGDVMKTWKSELEKNGKPERFFGNLPYNIAATLIADTIEQNIRFDRMVVTVQKEVAERMSAKYGTENYSSFSVLCGWAYNVKNIFDLAGGNFWPRPNVDSRAVLLTPKTDFPRCKNPSHFIKMQRALFSMRRKNLRNTLTSFLGNSELAEETLAKSKIDFKTRAEQLTIDQLLELSDILNSDIM